MSGPLNGNLRPALEWIGKLLLAGLCWFAIDTLTTTRAAIASLQEATEEGRGRITVLETLRPGDRQLLEQLVADQKATSLVVAKIAERLGIK